MSKSLSRRLLDRGVSKGGERYGLLAKTMQRDADVIRNLLTEAATDPGPAEA